MRLRLASGRATPGERVRASGGVGCPLAETKQTAAVIECHRCHAFAGTHMVTTLSLVRTTLPLVTTTISGEPDTAFARWYVP